MLERIIRSPLTMLFYMIVLTFLLLGLSSPAVLEGYEKYFYVGGLLLSFIFFLLIFIHNKRNPARKIRSVSLLPYEFKEEDEGRQWITYQACRKVYIFYSFAVPFGLVFLVTFREYFITPFLVLFIMSATQYTIYWLEERKFNADGSEEI